MGMLVVRGLDEKTLTGSHSGLEPMADSQPCGVTSFLMFYISVILAVLPFQWVPIAHLYNFLSAKEQIVSWWKRRFSRVLSRTRNS